jgi:hypothetical protein
VNRCTKCGWRWCCCIPPGASVDWFTAGPHDPVLGPWQRGTDPTMEILETIADINALPQSEWGPHLAELVAAYTPAQFVDAIMFATETRL